MQITSTTYMDFLLRNGLSRLRVVRSARRQYEDGYTQGKDYYRRVREGIIALHRSGGSIDELRKVVEDAPPEKRENFEAVGQGYESWMRGKGIVWSKRPKSNIWKHGGLRVLINPELLLNIDGVPYRVKLYFKSAPIRQVGANLVIHLHELAGLAAENVAVLDVRNGKMFTKSRTSPDYSTVLRSEALSFVAMWQAVGAQRQEDQEGAIS